MIGIERVEYTSNSGKRVEGYRVYFTYDLPSNGGESSGKAADRVFLSNSLFVQCRINVGDPAMPIYNKYGRCTGFLESV